MNKRDRHGAKPAKGMRGNSCFTMVPGEPPTRGRRKPDIPIEDILVVASLYGEEKLRFKYRQQLRRYQKQLQRANGEKSG